MKEWECVQVDHHKNVGKTIEEWQRNGWCLHTYQAQGFPTVVNHYLLFERESKEKVPQSAAAAAAAAAAG